MLLAIVGCSCDD
ncbi:hypothetical protein M3688_24400 [Brevibacillus borstelensis]|nr:hypothetical protein [Brevibacillus borstelensis]MCM3593538.1 hypothetical protein [Brevibacillus borstelensis]